MPALDAIMMDSLPPKARARGTAITGVITNIPWFFLPAIGGYLIDIHGVAGIRISYIFSGFTGVIAAYLRTRFLRETVDVKKIGRRGSIYRVILNSYAEIPYILKKIPREMIIYLLYLTLISTPSIIIFINYGVVYARDFLRINASEWGFYESLSNILITIFTLVCLPILDRVSRKILMAISAILVFTSYIIFIKASGWEIGLVLTLFNMAETVYHSAWTAYIADYTKRVLRGRIISVSNMLVSIGFSFFGIVLGYIYSQNPITAILLSILLSIIDFLFIVIVIKEPKLREI